MFPVVQTDNIRSPCIGWHTDCLNPPLEGTPLGDWFCPRCAPPIRGMSQPATIIYSDPLDVLATCAMASEPLREPSIAPSSHSAVNEASRSKRKGKSRAVVSDGSEADMDVDPAPGPSRLSTRLKSRRKSSMSEKPPTEPTSSPSQTVSLRRPRIRLSSPKLPPPLATIRLKLPARGKGKEREEDPDESKGMFDEFLTPEDRDVGATSVGINDKARFESSRSRAEVR